MVESISTEELKKKLDTDEDLVLIEVLSEEDYKDEHIKGAINIPLAVIGTEARDRFDTDTAIVVYCSSLSCQASPNAARKLEKLGFENVYDYREGKKAWKEAGYAME
jgi:rhodanese-related sulfurtransferase